MSVVMFPAGEKSYLTRCRMLVIELKQQLHFAVDEVNDEDLLKALLSFLHSTLERSNWTKAKQLQALEERERKLLRSQAKTNSSGSSRISLKDRYYFEDRAF